MTLTHAMWPRLLAFGFAAIAMTPLSARAQQPAPPPATGQPSPPAAGMPLSAYRPPALALVQPAAGGSVPQDRPVVVLRFLPGEPNDPIDARSFAVAVDGEERTRLFHVTAGEAWGPLSPLDDASALSAGAHQLVARICSSRGACADLSTSVSVAPSAVDGAEAEPPRSARRRKLFDALLDAVRKILVP